MYKSTDPHCYIKDVPLYLGTTSTEIGRLQIEVQVTLYDDVQVQNLQSIQKPRQRSFLVHSTQRVVIFNQQGLVVKPSQTQTSYLNYPTLLQNAVKLTASSGAQITTFLKDYSPQTVNTAVQSSGSSGDNSGHTTSASSSHTVGSSTSQTNSYSATSSVGVSDSLSDPTSVGVNESGSFTQGHSKTSSHSVSNTSSSGSSSSSGHQTSQSASMSIKDWGAYCLVNTPLSSPNWLFGQEYPWNAIDCRKTDGTQIGSLNPSNPTQVKLDIPTSMLARLVNGDCLYPPSQLAMFGLNFVTKALWLVTTENQAGSECVEVSHNLDYFSASHLIDTATKGVSVYLDQNETPLFAKEGGEITSELDLGILALAPLTATGGTAVTGFAPGKFIVPPLSTLNGTKPTHPFKIFSPGNDLMVVDSSTYPDAVGSAGFTLSEESALEATLDSSCSELSFTIFFKVLDTTKDYQLYLKNWKVNSAGIKLAMVFNEDPTTTLTRHIDAEQAEGGENNITTVSLRNLNYASINYHDYLQLGLNSIRISVQADEPADVASCVYQLKAVAIGSS